MDTSSTNNNNKNTHNIIVGSPPYTLADPASKPFRRVYYTGSCFCEKVKFEICREHPLDAKYCHCKGCQVLHGAPFQWAAIFEKSDVHFYEGKEYLVYWNSQNRNTDHVLPCKVYCDYCKTPIMDEGRNMLLLFPTLIHFKDVKSRSNFKPSCHIFYSRRIIDVPDGVPKWAGHKDESVQIPEALPAVDPP